MTTSVHCPHCGAPFREADARYCSFCGTERPVAAPPAPRSPDADERFEAAERSPAIGELLSRSPSTAKHAAGGACMLVFLAVFSAAAIAMTFAFHGVLGDLPVANTRWLVLVPAGIAVVGILGFLQILFRTTRLQTAELQRRIALVVDERVQVSGGKSTSTRYYATLQTRDRQRREYEVDARLAGTIAPSDMGMAYVKHDLLVDFQRIDV